MYGLANGCQPSVNALSADLLRLLFNQASALRLGVSTLGNGTRIIDAGIKYEGGLEAGRIIAEICLGGLGTVKFRSSPELRDWAWHVDVHTMQPVIACLGSQYAGWHLSYEDSENAFNALGSGPARAIGSKERLFKDIAYKDTALSTCLIIEADNIPPLEIAEDIAEMCDIPAHELTLILTPTSSLCGSVQIVARALETALHKAHALGFNLNKIIDGVGGAPLCPPSRDFLTAIGRTNDAILFAGQVHLFVQSGDVEAEELAHSLPSSSSDIYGKTFGEIFKDVDYDFYKIDPLLFSPAKVSVTAMGSGKTFHAGHIDSALLNKSFSGKLAGNDN